LSAVRVSGGQWSDKRGVSAQRALQSGHADNASFWRCGVGNKWNERHSNGGQVSERPIDAAQDVFDIGDA